ncbi:MAG: hypothetical protein WCF85_08050 [Rhodospirillaceae bacterium]
MTDIVVSLAELINDPIARQLMARDRVNPSDVFQLMATMKQRLKARAAKEDANKSKKGNCCTYAAAA